MHEPIRDVPKTMVRIITLLNTATVNVNALATEITIESIEYKIGMPVLKMKVSIMRSTATEIMDMTVISLDALIELLELWNGVPE